MTADLAQYYNVSLDDVWAGRVTPAHVLRLIGQLLSIPGSRVRMIALNMNPAQKEWDTNSEILAHIWDLQLTLALARANETDSNPERYPRPWNHSQKPEPEPETSPVASTVADFNVSSFLAEISK